MASLSLSRPAFMSAWPINSLTVRGSLLDGAKQEEFYSLVASRYLAFCTEAGDRDGLQQKFAQLAISSTTNLPTDAPPTPSSTGLSATSDRPASLDQILTALRKLREGLVASKRRDPFAAQVFLFAARLGILASAHETYLPSLLYLLRVLHPRPSDAAWPSPTPIQVPPCTSSSSTASPSSRRAPRTWPGLLTRVEHAEAAGYLVLDAACRRGDLAEAFALRRRHRLTDPRVDGALRALVADDWVRWRRVCGAADGYKARLLAYAQPRVRAHALKAFGRAYLAVDRAFLERQAMASWDELRAQYGVGWEVRDGKVVIRKIQGR